jgi:SAM-dependent methyltransferase
MLKLQIGAGLDGPPGWTNVDASPTLRLQRLPLVGGWLQGRVGPRFSPRVSYGDVVRGLPFGTGSVDCVYSSHVLEHLSFEDCLVALLEVHRVLRPGGVFRSVLPDLECEVRRYLESAEEDRASAFMRSTLMGTERRDRGIGGVLRAGLGNSKHLWMWDYRSLASRLRQAGFVDVRPAAFGDSAVAAFAEVEDPERWSDALGIECRKPIDAGEPVPPRRPEAP